jgi:hypothetical protein
MEDISFSSRFLCPAPAFIEDIMATSFILEDVQPLRGEIVPVRSVQETRPTEEFGLFLSQELKTYCILH